MHTRRLNVIKQKTSVRRYYKFSLMKGYLNIESAIGTEISKVGPHFRTIIESSFLRKGQKRGLRAIECPFCNPYHLDLTNKE